MSDTKAKLEAAEKALVELELHKNEHANARAARVRALQDGDKKKASEHEAAMAAHKKAHADKGITDRQIDEAAQAVLDLRAQLAKEGKK